jgi:uridine kinase
MAKPYIIAIGGPSGSGKSYLAAALTRELGDASVLSVDSYYHDLPQLSYEQRCAVNFDHPDSVDSALLASQLESITQGWPVKRPIYRFETHARAQATDPFLPRRYVIVEGIFALYFARVRELAQLKVFVKTPDAECFERRLDRDTVERGRTAASVTSQYEDTVRPMAFEYVWPTRHYANLVIPGNQSIGLSVEQVLAAMPSMAMAAAR